MRASEPGERQTKRGPGRPRLEGTPAETPRRASIRAAVARNGGSQAAAARELGLVRSTVWMAIHYDEKTRAARRARYVPVAERAERVGPSSGAAA